MPSIHISPASLTLAIGASAKLNTSAPSGVKWSSDAVKVALVTSDGSVIALSNGVATITARKGNVSAKSIITVGTGVPDAPPPPPPPPPVDPTPDPVEPPPVEEPPTPSDPVPPPVIGPVLSSAAMPFAGYAKLPFRTFNHYYGGGSAIRRVNGRLRVFTIYLSDAQPANYGLAEYEIETVAPVPDLATAPRMVGIADHGNVWAKCFANAGQTTEQVGYGAINPGGMLWDDVRKGLWITYGDPYGVSLPLHPTLAFVKFEGDRAVGLYGPWRQQLPPNQTRGTLTAIPKAFGDAYLGGARMGISSGSNSGIATCPRGCNLVAVEDFDPLTKPAATLPNPPYDPQSPGVQVKNRILFTHDIHHRQARDDRYKECGMWKPGDPVEKHYDCRIGSYAKRGLPAWGGPVTGGDNESDSVTGGLWIATPNTEGFFNFAQLVTTPEGYDPGGTDPDKLVHCGYADPEHATKSGSAAAGYENGKCCHGQADPFWGATGPFAHLVVPHAMFYNVSDFVRVLSGQVPVYGLTPTEIKQYTAGGKLSFPGIAMQQRSGWFGGNPSFDTESRYVIAVLRNVDSTSAFGDQQRQPCFAFFGPVA